MSDFSTALFIAMRKHSQGVMSGRGQKKGKGHFVREGDHGQAITFFICTCLCIIGLVRTFFFFFTVHSFVFYLDFLLFEID